MFAIISDYFLKSFLPYWWSINTCFVATALSFTWINWIPTRVDRSAAVSEYLGHSATHSYSWPDIFCVLSKCLLHCQPFSLRLNFYEPREEQGAECPSFLQSSTAADLDNVWTASQQVSWKKVGSRWSFQGHRPIAYILAALPMWLHSVNNITACDRQPSHCFMFLRDKSLKIHKNDLQHMCGTIFNILFSFFLCVCGNLLLVNYL